MCYRSQLLTSTSLHLQGCTQGFVVMGWGLREPQAHPRIHLLGFFLQNQSFLDNPSSNKLREPSDPRDGFGEASPSLGRAVVPQDTGGKRCVPACPQSPASSLSVLGMRKLSCPPTCQIMSPPSASVQLQVPRSEENNDTEWGRDIIMSSSTARGSSQSSQRRQGCFHVRGLHL